MVLDDICKVITCGVAKRPEYVKDGIPFLSSKNVKANRFILNHYNMVSKEDYLTLTKHNKPEKGDVLYTRVGSYGEAAIVDFDFDFAIFVSLTLIKPNFDLVDNRYLMHFLNSPKIRRLADESTSGIGVKNLNVKAVRSFPIELPPLPTQKKIAAILDEADSLRNLNKKLIEKYDALTQSLFLDMFGDPVTNPMGWEKVRMDKIMKIVRGGSPRPIDKYLGGKYPWIKIGDATKGGDIYLESTEQHIIEEGLRKTRLLPKGSLIFANCGVSLGFARIINFEGCIHDGWLAFSEFDDKRINKIFLLKALNSITRFFRETAPDGTQPNLNIGIMSKFEIILPKIELQNKFEKSLFVIEQQKAQAQQSLQKSEDLFNSLLQKAFKGELVK